MVFVISRSEAQTRAFAARFGLPVTTDIDAVVVEPAIYAVLLFTPPGARTSRFGSIRTYTNMSSRRIRGP
jgi:predicted dehydrogenase